MPVVGLLGRKITMTSVWNDQGQQVPVTEIEVGPCTVLQVKTRESDGYEALQIGFLPSKRKHATKPERGHCRKAGQEPFRHVREVRGADVSSAKLGDTIRCDRFSPGDRLLVSATSKGKGFAGVVRRHRFRGGPKTHGQSDRPRAPGSIGSSSYPSRVYPGTRMAGRMGGTRVTIRNLEVVRVDPETNRVLLRGAVPGARNSLVLLRKTL